jgi:membrane protease YdiL (CAAX protease family)
MNGIRSGLSIRARLTILAALAFCYWTSFQPSAWVLRHGLHAFGDPAYRGTGILIPHLLLYSTLTAACCAVAWWLLARARMLPPPQLAVTPAALAWGVGGGVASVAISLVVLPLLHFGHIHWIGVDGWNVAGNLFSNFFEEFIFRGLLLVGLTAVIGFWPAALLSSTAFGLEHSQYPVMLRAYVGLIGVFWCWIARRSRSLWAAWLAHMIADLVVDALVS